MKRFFGLLIAVAALSLCCLAQEYDGYIVRLKENTAQFLINEMSLFGSASLMSDMNDSDVVRLLSDEIPEVKEISADHNLVKAVDEDSLQKLISLGVVESFEEDIFLELYGYDYSANAGYSYQKWYLDAVNASFAWDAGIFGKDITVAVIDSGVYPHPDIENNIIPGRNYVEGEDVSDTVDKHFHGTAVAGLIAAQCNKLATVGISFRTKIVPLKVTNGSTFNVSLAEKAIYDAVDHFNCDVINLSLGVDADKRLLVELEKAVNYAIENNVVVVAAAGNGGGTAYSYPASYDNVVSVANAQQSGNTFTIYSTSRRNDKVDITAPGTSVASLNLSDGASTFTGTSFSCPIVAGAAALVKSIRPDFSQSQFENLIKSTANSSYITSSGQGVNAWGAGMLDIEKMFKTLLGAKKYYISENTSISGKDYVYITNLSEAETLKNYSVVISQEGVTGNAYIPVTVAPSSSVEICLSDKGFSVSANVELINDRVPGDVTGDNEVSLLDAVEILKQCAGFNVQSEKEQLDINNDGEVSILDVVIVLRYLAGYKVVFN